MYKTMMLISLCFCVCGYAVTETTWYDASDLRIDGKGWEHTPTPYCRLPVTVKDDVPESVWGHSKESAGLIIHFNTNASKIDFQWALTGGLAMPHMPVTGVSGIDLYQKSDDDAWYFQHCGRPVESENKATAVVNNPEGKVRGYKLYLPLYNGVKYLY